MRACALGLVRPTGGGRPFSTRCHTDVQPPPHTNTTELLVQIRVQVKNLKEQTAALEQLEAELAGKNTGKSVDQVRSFWMF